MTETALERSLKLRIVSQILQIQLPQYSFEPCRGFNYRRKIPDMAQPFRRGKMIIA
jgi:hypothetical protein